MSQRGAIEIQEPEGGWQRCRHQFFAGSAKGKLCGKPVVQAPDGGNYPFCKEHLQSDVDQVILSITGFDVSPFTDNLERTQRNVAQRGTNLKPRINAVTATEDEIDDEDLYVEPSRKRTPDDKIRLLERKNAMLERRVADLEASIESINRRQNQRDEYRG